MDALYEWFWNDDFWLPAGYTWEDNQPTAEVNKPRLTDLYIVPILAAFLLLVRYIFETYIATPFCLWLGIRIKPRKPHHSNQELPLIRKATECCWRSFFYFGLFLYGSYTLFTTEWFYSTDEWMKGYIREQDFNVYLKAYYLVELAFYTSLLFSQFVDAKRKDFLAMFIHHIVTIGLILISYTINHHRIGVVIMWLHDASDYWLDAAKVINYAKMQKLCDAFFVVFAITFYATRLVFYPFWVLDAFLFKAPAILGSGCGAHTFASIKLLVLQVLHIYWGYLIAQMVYKFTVHGKVEKDTRSGDESSDGEPDADVTVKND